jgi:NTP pyrophosphatase (non-canonical NTP hydrolase)
MEQGDLEHLRLKLRQFFEDRGWLGEVHSPKNLSMSLVSEAAELMQHFRWEIGESKPLSEEMIGLIRDEIGDVLINLVALADVCNIDPLDAAWHKLKKIGERYPSPK